MASNRVTETKVVGRDGAPADILVELTFANSKMPQAIRMTYAVANRLCEQIRSELKVAGSSPPPA